MNTRWETEEADPDWTQYLVTYFGALFEHADAGLDTLRRIDCRQTVCRISIEFRGQPALLRGAEAFRTDGYRFNYRMQQPDSGPQAIDVLVMRNAQ